MSYTSTFLLIILNFIHTLLVKGDPGAPTKALERGASMGL